MTIGNMAGGDHFANLLVEQEKWRGLMKIKKWLGHEFESSTGRTPDYLRWHRDFKAAIRQQLPEGAELIMSKPNHFDASGFVKLGDKYVYFSVSDIRHWQDEWFRNILIRTAKSDKDYTGGRNCRTTFNDFTTNVERLFLEAN